MRVGHPFLQDEAGQVIDLRNDHHPIRQKPDGCAPMPDQPQVSRQRQPYERRSEQRNDRSDTSYYAPKQRPRHTAQPIADQSDRPLYDREQGNADCIRTDDHHHFARKLLSNRPVKRDELA